MSCASNDEYHQNLYLLDLSTVKAAFSLVGGYRNFSVTMTVSSCGNNSNLLTLFKLRTCVAAQHYPRKLIVFNIKHFPVATLSLMLGETTVSFSLPDTQFLSVRLDNHRWLSIFCSPEVDR